MFRRWRERRTPTVPAMPVRSESGVVFSNGTTMVDVAGESHHVDAIREAVARTPAGEAYTALLIPEPSNPHDPNAVAVNLQGQCVGYLPRDIAAVMAPGVVRLSAEHSGAPVACVAEVRNDWSIPSVVLRLDPADFGIDVAAVRSVSSLARSAERLSAELLRTPMPAAPNSPLQDPKGRRLLAMAEQAWRRAEEERDRSSHTTAAVERRFRDAIARLERARDPQIAVAWLGLARALRYQRGRRDEVLTAFLTALRLDRFHGEAWKEYLDYLSLSPSLEFLVAVFQAMPPPIRKAMAPDLLRISRYQDRHGQLPAGEGPRLQQALLETATAASDDETVAWLAGELGLLAEQDHRPTEAVALWRRAVAAGSRDPRVADRLSILLIRDGEVEEAATVLREALAARPPDPQLAERMTRRLARCERPEVTPVMLLDRGQPGHQCSICGQQGHNRRTCPQRLS